MARFSCGLILPFPPIEKHSYMRCATPTTLSEAWIVPEMELTPRPPPNSATPLVSLKAEAGPAPTPDHKDLRNTTAVSRTRKTEPRHWLSRSWEDETRRRHIPRNRIRGRQSSSRGVLVMSNSVRPVLEWCAIVIGTQFPSLHSRRSFQSCAIGRRREHENRVCFHRG